MILFIFQVIVLIAVIFGLKAMTESAFASSLQTGDLDAHILLQRLFYSPAGFVLIEDGRMYPGIIIPEQFTQVTIDQLYDPAAKGDFAIKTTLVDGTSATTLYHNQEQYDIIKPLLFSKQYAEMNTSDYVLIKKGDTLVPGRLDAEILYATGKRD